MSVNVSRGDATGLAYFSRQDDKMAAAAAIAATRNALTSEPYDLVSVPGGRTYAVPREVCQFLTGDSDE